MLAPIMKGGKQIRNTIKYWAVFPSIFFIKDADKKEKAIINDVAAVTI